MTELYNSDGSCSLSGVASAMTLAAVGRHCWGRVLHRARGSQNRWKPCAFQSWMGRSPALQVQLQPPSRGCEPGHSRALGAKKAPYPHRLGSPCSPPYSRCLV